MSTSHYRSVFAPGVFKGRVIVVTGGGSGIGRCTAHELAALGATLGNVTDACCSDRTMRWPCIGIARRQSSNMHWRNTI